MLIWAAALLVAAQTAAPLAQAHPAEPEFGSTLISKVPPKPEFRELSFETELGVWVGSNDPSVSYQSQVALRYFDKRFVAFYPVFQRGSRRFVVRSLSTFGPHPLHPLWADSRTCPAVLDRLKSLDDFPLTVSAPLGLTAKKATGMNIDGIGIVLRVNGLAGDGWPVGTTISGNAYPLVA